MSQLTKLIGLDQDGYELTNAIYSPSNSNMNSILSLCIRIAGEKEYVDIFGIEAESKYNILRDYGFPVEREYASFQE